MPPSAAAPPLVLDGDLDPTRFAHLTPPTTDRAPTIGELAHRARTVAARHDDWRHLVRFNSEHRWRLRLRRDATYEVWLMSWLPGQRTGAHDHGESTAAIAVAYGALDEHTLLTTQRRPRIQRIEVEQVRIWGARHIREIVNAGDAPAVSVHVYAPAPP